MDDLLTAVWQTCVHAAAIEEDLSYMAFVQQWQVLVKAPVLAMLIHMSRNMLHSLEAACYVTVGTFTQCGLSCLPRHWVTRVGGSEYKGKV